MMKSVKKSVEVLNNESKEVHRSEQSQFESGSYGLNIGDLVFMSDLVPGNSSIPGLLLSIPDSVGQVDVLVGGAKKKVHWNQVKPYVDNVDN